MSAPLLTTARRTAALLGPGWSAVPDPHWPRAVQLTKPRPHKDPYQIRISDEGKDRLVIYGLIGSHGDHRISLGGIETPQISVRGDLPARQLPRHLATHLQRRLLPAYDTALTQVTETRARHQDLAAARTATVELLKDAMPGSWASTTGGEDRPTVHSPYEGPGEMGITAHINRDGTHVGLGLRSLTPEQAVQVCRLLLTAQQ
jgi:hypothetical protein